MKDVGFGQRAQIEKMLDKKKAIIPRANLEMILD